MGEDASAPTKPEPTPETQSLYALASLVFGDAETTSYVSLVDSLDDDVDFDEAREFAGAADIWWHQGALYVASDEDKTISKFTVDDGSLKKVDSFSLANFGPTSFGFWLNAFVAPDKAYFSIASGKEFVVWDPADMSVAQETIVMPEMPPRDGLEAFNAYADRASVQLGNLLYLPFYYTDATYLEFADSSSIVVIDTETDEVVEVLDAPCPGIDFVTHDEDDNLYFSAWGYAAAGAATLEQPTTCVAKLAKGDDELTKLFDMPDVTDGREGGALHYLGNGKAIMSVLHDDHSEATDPAEIAWGPNWRFWLYDMNEGSAEIIDDLDWNVGAVYYHQIDGELQMLIPAGDFASTALYTFDPDGSVRQRLETQGWTLRLFDIDGHVEDDVPASNLDAGAAESSDAGASNEDEDAATESTSGDSGTTEDADALYAVMFEVYDDVGSSSYLSLVDSLGVERVDASTAREYPDGRAFLQSYNEWVFVGHPATPLVTRYEVTAENELEETGSVGFGNFGLTAGGLDDWNVTFISPTKAYLADLKEGITIIWNPTTMEIIGEIPPEPEFYREGLTLEFSPGALRGNRMYRTFTWANYDTAEYARDQLLAVYDVETDELIELVEETRCPALGNLVHQDEAGNIYFSNWIWPIAGTFLYDAPKSCVLRINAGEDTFDADWSLSYADLVDGREGAMFSYMGDGKALFSVFHDERISIEEGTDPWAYAGSQNWTIWSLDMDSLDVTRVDGIDYNAGAFTPLRLNGRSFVMVPNSDWSETQLYEINGTNAKPSLIVPGWSYQFKTVR